MRRYILGAGATIVGALSVSAALAGQPQPQERSVEGLIFDLQHPEADRRQEAARVIARNRLREAVPALVEAVGDPDDDARYEIARALVALNDSRALQAYIQLTLDERSMIQEKAIEGIINLYVADEGGFVQGLKKFANLVNPFSDDYNALVIEPYVVVDPSPINALADLLSDDDRRIRRDAATALGILQAQSALPAMQEALDRETASDVSLELIRAMYKIGDPAAGRTLIPRMLDSDKRIHDEAIFTVGRLKIGEAVPQLTSMYAAGVEERRRIFGVLPISGPDDLQQQILEALAYIGDPSSEELFVTALDDERAWARQYGAEGLGRAGADEHVSSLAERHLREPSDSAKLAMGYALYLLGRTEHLTELVGEVTGSDQAYGYLLELEPEQADQLHPYVRQERDDIKLKLLEIIGFRGSAASIAVAEEFTQSENIDLANAATLAISRLRGRFPGA